MLEMCRVVVNVVLPNKVEMVVSGGDEGGQWRSVMEVGKVMVKDETTEEDTVCCWWQFQP